VHCCSRPREGDTFAPLLVASTWASIQIDIYMAALRVLLIMAFVAPLSRAATITIEAGGSINLEGGTGVTEMLETIQDLQDQLNNATSRIASLEAATARIAALEAQMLVVGNSVQFPPLTPLPNSPPATPRPPFAPAVYGWVQQTSTECGATNAENTAAAAAGVPMHSPTANDNSHLSWAAVAQAALRTIGECKQYCIETPFCRAIEVATNSADDSTSVGCTLMHSGTNGGSWHLGSCWYMTVNGAVPSYEDRALI